jgi:hypothetical protein
MNPPPGRRTMSPREVSGRPLERRLTKHWRHEIKMRFGIEMLSAPYPAPALWCTRCCPVKPIACGRPEQLYGAASLASFFSFVKGVHRYGVLSDLYGLHLDSETLDAYNVHPSSLTDDRKRELGSIIGSKCRRAGLVAIIFYNSSPLMSLPYFEMLAASGIPALYTTRLPR